MRIKEIINKGIDRWSNTKFSELTSEVLYSRQYGELLESLGVEGLTLKKTWHKADNNAW